MNLCYLIINTVTGGDNMRWDIQLPPPQKPRSPLTWGAQYGQLPGSLVPRILCANWMSLGMMVTLFAWIYTRRITLLLICITNFMYKHIWNPSRIMSSNQAINVALTAHKFTSSNRPTRYASAPSWRVQEGLKLTHRCRYRRKSLWSCYDSPANRSRRSSYRSFPAHGQVRIIKEHSKENEQTDL